MNHVAGPSASTLTNDDEVYSRLHLQQGKFFDHINQVDRNMYICHAGPSGHAHDDGSLSYEDFSMDRLAPSPLPDDGAGMGGNLEGEDVYGLSNLHRSR